MAEFLLELLSEEIPARMQPRAAAELKRLGADKLKAVGLACESLDSYVTPRRLTLVATGLPARQPDTTEEKKGPKVGASDKAVEGFLRANGLASVDDAEVRETEKGAFYFVVRHTRGRATAEVLAEIVPELARELPWPTSMRWARNTFRYVRPLHGVVVLLDGKPLSGGLDLGGETLHFGRETRGHRFLAPEPFPVESFVDYRDRLARANVILDPVGRRARICEQAEKLAASQGLRVKDDPGLLDENVGLTEWPVVLMGTIDQQFMELPPEVLTVSMRTHQKYFALETPDGALANRFLLVANIETANGGEAIVAGNERVLRARLADAAFFWAQDRKEELVERVTQLQQVIFHARLGSLREKVDRVEALAVHLARWIEGAGRDKVRSAALLSKADLTTEMVGEFPELQGIMGRYYALGDGETPEVAEAIAEHYAPQGPNDRCPTAPVSVAVALADKLDTLTGFFAIDERPTGSKDPYALRRAALGIIRLIVENVLRLPLREALAEAFRLLPEEVRAGRDADALTGEVLAFLMDRLKVVLRDRGVRHDLISAVFAVETPEGGAEDDLVRLLARVDALARFLESEDGANLLVAYRRAANIVRIEEKKDRATYDGEVDAGLLRDAAEQVLYDALNEAEERAERALAEEDFTAAMAALAGLRQPVDSFFDTVTVNADDRALRHNRLRFLKRIGATLARVADFSKIEG